MSELGLQHQNASMNCSSYGWLINIPALLFDISGKCGEIGNFQVFNTKAPTEYCHWKSHISVSGLLHLDTYHLLSADSFIKQASKQAIYPSIHSSIIYQPIEINLSIRLAYIFLYQIPTNQHYSIPRVFGKIQRNFGAKIGPACVLCDSHIFHLTAEREGKKQQSLELQLSNLASRPSSSQKRKARCLSWKMHSIRKKNTPISNWSSLRSASVKGLQAQARTCLVSEEPGSHILNQPTQSSVHVSASRLQHLWAVSAISLLNSDVLSCTT